MKLIRVLSVIFLMLSNSVTGFAQYACVVLPDRVKIALNEKDTLFIRPLAPNAIRIQVQKGNLFEKEELIYNNINATPKFNCQETSAELVIKTAEIQLTFNKKTSQLVFANKKGEVFLSEIAGSRNLTSTKVMNSDAVSVTQSFYSPANECIYGLGQFQDGQSNLRNITRKLTQVNSQIAIPFIYSNKGYGLLWHQYGLTDFNPADNFIALEKISDNSNNTQLADVTTAAGTQKVNQNQHKYSGKFTVPASGLYGIMLDLGDMDNRHFVAIDGKPCINQYNYWLPPTQSTMVQLEAGEHRVELICKANNTPKLSWRKSDNSTTFISPHAKVLDYTVFYGPDADKVIATFRNLSGNVPMLPQWAFGFWQCRERYTSSQHLIETVQEFRKRNIPIDVIVQDWQYWGKYGWGAMKFDETYYPDPQKLTDELHKLNVHFNISVWENVDKNSELGKSYTANNLYIKNSKWLDVTNPAARKAHWEAMNQNMFSVGVDSWWLDATEPENDALHGAETYLGSGYFYRLTYPLFTNRAVYEGQRATTSDKRVCILTRSAFAGQQRYGTINWSGDVNGTWDGFRRQITAGLNYNITGNPYWTTDIGGFFRPGNQQYTNTKFHELLTRWFQWGVFNPVFRIHGYQTETEPWKYGTEVEQNMRSMIDLRYQLLPYIYSEAWQVSKNGSTMMRPLVMDYHNDSLALKQNYQYMFGKSLLVTPITEAEKTECDVYLPNGNSWYNFFTDKYFQGGQTVKTAAPLSEIPVYVKAGSIIPFGKKLQYTNEKPADTLEIRVYTGANAHFELYEDEGDNYNYEAGKYSTICFDWNEKQQKLTIGKRYGSYNGAINSRIFNIVWVENKGNVKIKSTDRKCIRYECKSIKIRR